MLHMIPTSHHISMQAYQMCLSDKFNGLGVHSLSAWLKRPYTTLLYNTLSLPRAQFNKGMLLLSGVCGPQYVKTWLARHKADEPSQHIIYLWCMYDNTPKRRQPV